MPPPPSTRKCRLAGSCKMVSRDPHNLNIIIIFISYFHLISLRNGMGNPRQSTKNVCYTSTTRNAGREKYIRTMPCIERILLYKYVPSVHSLRAGQKYLAYVAKVKQFLKALLLILKIIETWVACRGSFAIHWCGRLLCRDVGDWDWECCWQQGVVARRGRHRHATKVDKSLHPLKLSLVLDE